MILVRPLGFGMILGMVAFQVTLLVFSAASMLKSVRAMIFEDTTIEVGHHTTWVIGGLTFNADTIVATAIAACFVMILGLLVARSASSEVPANSSSSGRPWSSRSRTRWGGDLRERAPFVVPLAVPLFVFILTCNSMGLLPGGWGPELFRPPTSDVNLTYALGFTVFFWSPGGRHPDPGGQGLLPPPQGGRSR